MRSRSILNTKSIMLVIMLFIAAPLAFSMNCIIPSVEEEKLLSMSYDDFDQSKTGWRQYVKENCYYQTGVLIDKYLDKNKNRLQDWQLIGVTWHAGQMYAFSNDYEIAKARFKQSINPNEPENTPVLWNDYVDATIAFLDNDMPQLTLHRNHIANGTNTVMNKQNLEVVDSLVQHFGQPYSVAYHPQG